MKLNWNFNTLSMGGGMGIFSGKTIALSCSYQEFFTFESILEFFFI